MENDTETENLRKQCVNQREQMARLFDLWYELADQGESAAFAAYDSYSIAVGRLNELMRQYSRAKVQ